MPRFIHARVTPDGVRFREWSTIVDKYLTPPLTREEMAERLVEAEADAFERAKREVAVRLDRTATCGSSQQYRDQDPDELAEPWDTEVCDGCGGFHHAFETRAGDRDCRQCGNPADDRAHGEACQVAP